MLQVESGLASPACKQRQLHSTNDNLPEMLTAPLSGASKLPQAESEHNWLPPSVTSGTWVAIRSSDMPDMITYELQGVNHTASIGFHSQTRDLNKQCMFETLASTDFLSSEGPLRRYIYRDL